MSHKLLIMAGGTGGHVFPGLAIAQALGARGWRIHWQGTAGGIEQRLVTAAGYPLDSIAITGVRGKGMRAWLGLPFRMLRACWQAHVLLARVRPDVVLGIGGYMSVPGGLMAYLTRRPLVILEPGARAGIANRLLACFARRVLVGFPHAFDEPIDSRVARWLPKPSTVDVCGTPLRAEMLTQPEPAARFAGRSGPLRLLVVGGSLGAQAVNDLIVAALQRVHPSARPQVVHQAGDKNHAAVQARYAEAQIEADVRAFIGDMASAYAACDLLICRAGAITVAEVAAIGVAPLLIPLPWFVGDEQRANARFLADAGAGRILDQQSTTPEALAALLTQLTRETLLAWAEAAHRLGKRDATERAAAACASLVVA